MLRNSLFELLCLDALLALSSANVAITLTSKGNASQVQHLGPPHSYSIQGLRQRQKTLKAVWSPGKKGAGGCELGCKGALSPRPVFTLAIHFYLYLVYLIRRLFYSLASSLLQDFGGNLGSGDCSSAFDNKMFCAARCEFHLPRSIC